MRPYLLNFIFVLVLFLLVPFVVHAARLPVRFNQFWLQNLNLRYGIFSFDDILDTVHSAYSSGINIIERKPQDSMPSLDNKLEFFSYIFSWVPPYAVVYPTEGFYYFRIDIDGKDYWGNIRIADLDKGSLSFAYFSEPEKEISKENNIKKPTYVITVAKEDGLQINKKLEDIYEVTFRNKTVTFKHGGTDRLPPKRLRTLVEEEFVGQIYDESGIRFFMYFNHKTNSFYNILNEEDGCPDTLESVGDSSFLLGKRTGFCYFYDQEYDRKLLVGTFNNNSADNNYLDGPGDQVPFRADLKEKLFVAYPNTLLGDSIDSHGVYLNRDQWVRIAVSPFHIYRSINGLMEYCSRSDYLNLSGSELWTALTKEWWNNPQWRSGIVKKLVEEEQKDIKAYIPQDKLEQFLSTLADPIETLETKGSNGKVN